MAVETDPQVEPGPTALESNPPVESEPVTVVESEPATAVKSEEKLKIDTPEKLEKSEKADSSSTPSTVSRYGRARKPKVSSDFVLHKSVKNFLGSNESPLNASPNGSEPSTPAMKRKRASMKNSAPDSENVEVNGIKSRKSGINFQNGEVKLPEPVTPLSVANSPGNIETAKKRGRKKMTETPVTENVDPAPNSVTPSEVRPAKVAKPGVTPKASFNSVLENSTASLRTPNDASASKTFETVTSAELSRSSLGSVGSARSLGTPRVATPVKVVKPHGGRKSNLNPVPENPVANPQTPDEGSSVTPATGTFSGMKVASVSIPLLSDAVISTARNSLDNTPNTDISKAAKPRGRPRLSLPPSLPSVPENPAANPPTPKAAESQIGTTSTPVAEDSTQSTEVITTPTVVLTPLKMSSSDTPSTSLTPYSEFVGHLDKNWLAGDVAWGCVGRYPYWPCIVMLDPVSKSQVVEKAGRGSVPFKRYFVQFCADNGRHSWVGAKNLLEFKNKCQFSDLQEKVFQDPRKKQAFGSKFTLKPQGREAWDRAAAEAEYLMSLSREDRIQHYQRLYPMETPKTKKDLLALLAEEEAKPDRQSPKPSMSGEPSSKNSQKRQTSADAESSDAADSPKKGTIVKNKGKLKLKRAKSINSLKLTLKEKMLPNKKLALLKKKKLKMQLLQKGLKDEKVKRADRKKNKANKIDEAKVSAKNTSKTAPEDEKMEVDEMPESPAEAKNDKNAKKQKKKRKRKQDFGPDFDVYCSKNFDRIADEHPHLKDEEIQKYLQKSWLEMDETQKLKYKARLVKDDSSGEEERNEAESESSESESEAAASVPDPVTKETRDASATKETKEIKEVTAPKETKEASSPKETKEVSPSKETKETSPPPVVEAASKIKKPSICLFRYSDDEVQSEAQGEDLNKE